MIIILYYLLHQQPTTNNQQPTTTILQLSPDPTFHFELLRVLSHARYSGSDIAEVLVAASQIVPGDFRSWYRAFNNLAFRVQFQIPIPPPNHPLSQSQKITIRDLNFHASNYFRAAGFFLHGNPNDKRIAELWERQTATFDAAIALLPVPGKRVTIPSKHGFEIPAIFYAASPIDEDGKGKGKGKGKPTIILGNGYDGSQEELLHVSGLAALERGFNVLTYEGPGQPSVRRSQNLGFIPDWEKVVSPCIDYLYTLPEVDKERIALFGYSMGGYLAAKASLLIFKNPSPPGLTMGRKKNSTKLDALS
ncbi:hypothetical protein G7Y89_g12676 [Cudoniella acicularis]|uniref:AB hydrolase-1 domain-containing protein n=1 Tax=Cudoniella acicularis TaxID=354080 RepID=A0A8H4R8N5_9HELO|nr:hypothetical protein G7Y89_g12676 [Cudoniella acicularis]